MQWGDSAFVYSQLSRDRIKTGSELFLNMLWNLGRYFWIAQPCEPESKFFNNVPAFWSCANEMIHSLLRMVNHSEGHGIKLRSMKVTTSPALMTEVVKGNANLRQSSIAGNYRATAAHGAAGIFSRNAARGRLFVSEFAQSAFPGEKSPSDIEKGPPVFLDSGGRLAISPALKGMVKRRRADPHRVKLRERKALWAG